MSDDGVRTVLDPAPAPPDGGDADYRTLVERARVGLFRSRLEDGRLLLVNSAAARLAGFDDPAEMEGSLDTLMFYRDPADRRRLLEALTRYGEVSGVEVELLRRDGQPLWVRVSARLVSERGWIEAVIEDVTEERRVRSELSRVQAVEEVMLKIAGAAGEVDDVAGLIARVREMLGEVIDTGNFFVALYDEESRLYSFPFYRDQHDELSEYERRPLPNSLTDRVRRLGEPTFLTRQAHDALQQAGEVGLVGTPAQLWLGVPLRTERGVIGVMVVQSYDDPERYSTRDLELLAYAAGPVATAVERKRAEEQRRLMEHRLSRMQKLQSLGVLAGGIAHDFNNLLQGIVGGTSLARLRLDEPDAVLAQLDRIERAAESAAELVRQLLAYAGHGAMVVEELDVGGLVREMEPLLRTLLTRSAELEVRIDDQAGPITVTADASEVRQLVLNLVSNASEAVAERHGTVSVAVSNELRSRAALERSAMAETAHTGRFVAIEVSDDGPGMAPEVQARMFEPFFSTKFVGRGMGLAAVHGIVRGARGAIEVASQPDRGTTIRALLPVSRPDAEAAGTGTGGTVGERRRPRLLVVDDDANVRETAAQLLDLAGFEVASAEDGHDAVALVRRAPAAFDAVLLDLTMPRMGGREALQELHSVRSDLPVVLMSGYSEAEAVENLGGPTPAGFLQKPFRYDDLVEAMRGVLGDLRT